MLRVREMSSAAHQFIFQYQTESTEYMYAQVTFID